MEIEEVRAVTDELVSAWARLMPQLSTTAAPPNRAELEDILRTSTLLVARDGAVVVGSLCLTFYRIPTGLQARIDDVVVDTGARGKGVGEALSNDAITRSRARGAKGVHLTSHASREAANRLYLRLGFVRRETNVYVMKLG